MFSGAVVDCDCDGPEPIPCLAPLFNIAGKERVLQDIVQGVQITRARRLRRQKLVESRLGVTIRTYRPVFIYLLGVLILES